MYEDVNRKYKICTIYDCFSYRKVPNGQKSEQIRGLQKSLLCVLALNYRQKNKVASDQLARGAHSQFTVSGKATQAPS